MTTISGQDAHQRFAWIAPMQGPVVDWTDSNAFHRHGVVGEGLTGWLASDRDDPGKGAAGGGQGT